QVRCSGPGLERGRVGETGEFVVDCTNAGPAELTIEIISDGGTEAEVHIQDNGDGTYTITYIPLYPGCYTLTIRYGGQDVPNFPAQLKTNLLRSHQILLLKVSSWFCPCRDTKVKCQGPGLGNAVRANIPQAFTVDASKAGVAPLQVRGAELDVDVVENEDGTFDIFYTAPQPGEYIICVRFGGEHIPNSPFQVTVSDVEIWYQGLGGFGRSRNCGGTKHG
uniref:Filamin C, gamma b (actin binding protein 280) n=1 Tax=Oryzias melastigma TaxID=30732 RepID=A0A3B3BXH0_ORYME